MQEDLTTIDKIPAFPEIEDRKLTRVTGMGNTIRTKDPKDCCSTMKVESATTRFWTTSKLSDELELQIYISPELSTRRKKKGNGCRKTRRQLISKGFDPKTIRRKNLMREVLEGGQWLSIAESGANWNWANGPQQVTTSNDDANLQQMSTSSTFFLLYRSVY